MIVVRIGEPAELSFRAETFEFGMGAREGSIHFGGGGSGKVSWSDATLTRKSDGQSPALFQRCVKRTPATISVNVARDPSFARENPADFDGLPRAGRVFLACYTLKDAVLSSYQAGPGETEAIGLSYKSMKSAFFQEPAAE